MSLITKPIPNALQRRASELPCDGAKRFKVGRLRDLSYSEARAAILAESTIGPNGRGGSVLKRGTAQRLADLNRTYYRVAKTFVDAKIKEMQAAHESRLASAADAPKMADEVDDGGAVGANIVVNGSDAPRDACEEAKNGIAQAPVVVDDAIPAASPEEVRMATSLDVDGMVFGSKLNILSDKFPVMSAVLSRNKSGFRCVINGQEARSRNATKIKELITIALGEGWTTCAIE